MLECATEFLFSEYRSGFHNKHNCPLQCVQVHVVNYFSGTEFCCLLWWIDILHGRALAEWTTTLMKMIRKHHKTTVARYQTKLLNPAQHRYLLVCK